VSRDHAGRCGSGATNSFVPTVAMIVFRIDVHAEPSLIQSAAVGSSTVPIEGG
jgi:hypothetical protein